VRANLSISFILYRRRVIAVPVQNRPWACVCILLLCGGAAVAWGQSNRNPPSGESGLGPKPVTVNRTVPKVEPPRSGLTFSDQPTVQEISRARVFQEPLVPIGGTPSAAENSALAAALLGYAKRSGPNDFASLAAFLEQHPESPWRAALLTCLGLEYYNTAYYSRALEAWQEAWGLGQKATDAKGKFLADRAVCELAGLYSRLGRMTELEALLKSVEKRGFIGGATERINLAWEALSTMRNQPGVSFRCGPLALKSILRSDEKLRTSCPTNAFMEIFNSASTHEGFSLSQVAELSKKIGLNYQMAFRPPSEKSKIDFIVPSVVHWKVGHYAAIVRRDGDRYLVEDLTFRTTVWATREALEAETSGYFLIPPGELPRGWRSIDAREGATIWGKGVTSGNDPDHYTCSGEQTASCTGSGCGMPVASVHLMLANLQIRDTPVGYTPPVGPPVYFTVRYNHRDYLQPPSQVDKLLGPKWTHDWHGYIQIDGANAKHFVEGGGARIFTQFDPVTQTYAPNQYDHSLLRRSGPDRYEMTWPDGSKKIFGHSGTLGALLTRVVDPAGNAVTLTYNGDRLVALTDAIGQVTTISYEHPNNPELITKVTDPFGRFALFEYDDFGIPLDYAVKPPLETHGTNHFHLSMLISITDVLGLQSGFRYIQVNTFHREDDNPADPITFLNNHPGYVDIIQSMITPYGTTSFTLSGGPPSTNNTRVTEITYPDRSRERVEFNQTLGLVPSSDPPASLPAGMSTFNNQFLYGRNTYYWSRTALASSVGLYSRARIYHWLHTENQALTAGVLESIKEPLEGRVWFNYPGQEFPIEIGTSSRPTHIGRVLEDGQTQLYTNAYNALGQVTESMDPVGRRLKYLYASNGIDLLEVRQTRGGNNELLARMTYNGQHLPLTVVDAAGQTNILTYNARGQLLSETNPRGETTAYTYDTDGYLVAVDGPLPGTSDTVSATYDFFGRVRTTTGLSGYALTFDYDVMNRVTKITHPDSTFEQFFYDRLDLTNVTDRAGRQTLFEYDNMRQVKKQTDPLGRVMHFEWCRCGDIKSLTDPMGRTTSWLTDVQGRVTGKRYGDGSLVSYAYESASSRLKHVIDEKDQVTQFDWNRDDTLNSIAYGSAAIPTPGVSFTYDPNYQRVTSMTDGTGTTLYSYNAVTGTPTLGAGALASVDGPLPNDTITYGYDELGRPIHRAINGVGLAVTLDAAGRPIGMTNALGGFAYGYDGSTVRLVSKSLPNGQTEERSYGNNLQDRMLQRITHQVGATPLSEFLYGHDVSRSRIATWSQQAGAQSPSLHTFGYDAVNQLLSATVTNTGSLVSTFAYSYDPAANRLIEQVGASSHTATYNALNEISTTTAPGITRTNEWDAEDRLVAVNIGNRRTEFTYDGLSRRVGIRQLLNGSEVSFRRFVWCGGEICEERDATGVVTKRFFPQGMKAETGPVTGSFYYTRDHLGSIRELTDSTGNVRARYAYDPYGRRTKLAGDIETDFGFAGMFWSAEANLSLTHYRAYDIELGRWLSRDPLPAAEMLQGPNLYVYVANDPVNLIDIEGLAIGDTLRGWFARHCAANPVACKEVAKAAGAGAGSTGEALRRNIQTLPQFAPQVGNTIQCGAEKTLPALGNTMNSIPNVVPAAVNVGYKVVRMAPDVAHHFRSQLPSVNWFIRQMNANKAYLDHLWATDPAAARNFISYLDWYSKNLLWPY
jgi:RHS repeat-associated protein